MARRKLQHLRERLAAARVEVVDSEARDRLQQDLAPISEPHLRRLLIESGVPLDPLVEGVRQDSLDEAERTLTALSARYPKFPKETRALVIKAKDHARLAIGRLQDEADRAERQEMVEWMIVWVNDPPLFPTWVRLRRAAIESLSSGL